MDDENKHPTRLALVLVVLVLALVIISVNQFVETGEEPQEASVLRAYAR